MSGKKPRYLAEFELYLMLAIVRRGGEAYGAEIMREIEQRTSRPVSIGAVYSTAARLEKKGFLDHRVSDPIPVKGGRARKYYHLTGAGLEAVRTSVGMLSSMVDGVDVLREES